MARFTLVHSKDIENRAEKGVFKMFKGPLEAEQVTISYRTFPPKSGQRDSGKAHKHEQIEEVVYLVSGELLVKLDDEIITMRAGDALRISPEVMRAYQNDGSEETIAVIASPVLADQKSDGIHAEDFWQ